MSAAQDNATPPRRQARSEATRTRLLQAALVEFAAHGFEAASTRTIATAAGTQQPQINYHFASKEALWHEAVDLLFEQLDVAMQRTIDAGPPAKDPRSVFAASVRAFVHAVAELPELNRIMVHEATADSGRLQWIVERHTKPRFEAITDAWQHLRVAGEVLDIDAAVFYYTLVGAASLAYVNAPEAAMLGHDTRTPDFIDAHADAVVAMLLGPNDALNKRKRMTT